MLHPTQLRTVLEQDDVIIIDARGGPDALDRYKQSHVKGALRVDLETELSQKGISAADGGRHPLPSPERFGAVLSRLGIPPTSHVIVYDDKNGANAAARFWWMMVAAGHSKIDVVDGTLEHMQQAGIPFVSGDPPAPSTPTRYAIQKWLLETATIDDVAKSVNDPSMLVIDVRENYRYRGDSEPIDLIAGHIPGAINVPYTSNLSAEGKFLTSDELSSKYKEILGDRKADQVIIHCGSGVTACHTLLAMDQAGIQGAKLYVGSWSEWSRKKL
ncbi:MAG TPA: sulfurtransferase [Chryseolinea sp.]|nr:sulfurtransferase [Chryseolinea sp.]